MSIAFLTLWLRVIRLCNLDMFVIDTSGYEGRGMSGSIERAAADHGVDTSGRDAEQLVTLREHQ